MQIVRDPLWKNIEISQNLLDITNTKEFTRISNIKQLGPTHFVYPGATHTRFAHSLGVYHIATKLIDNLQKKEHLIGQQLKGFWLFRLLPFATI
jgi:HD superfamily phosphohydrolase